MSLQNRMKNALLEKEKEGSLRQLTVSQNKIDFVSNDYLGLARSAALHQNIEERYHQLPFSKNGSTGSRLLAGNSALAEEVESYLAKIFKAEQAVIFNSGYAANQAALSCIPQKGDTILYDELVHACMHDGMKLSRAERKSFKHNNLQDLEDQLRETDGKKFIAIESIYSMDGNQAPLTEIVNLAEQFDASIILDEAHSTGAYGKNGAGLAVSLGLGSKIDARIYTFGKAMGVHGACIAGSSTLANYLVNFARPFIFSTALSPHSLVSIQCAFGFLQNQLYLQESLQQNIQFFLQNYQQNNLPNKIESQSAIQSVLINGNKQVMALAEQLQQNGMDCRGIRFPSIKKGSERIRICLHAYNTETEIKKLINTMKIF